jgi:excisionase family DNA binding protein
MAKTETWLDSTELAEYLKISRRTLDTWAYKGTGPKYALMGRHRRYRLSDVEKWADEQSKGGAA